MTSTSGIPNDVILTPADRTPATVTVYSPVFAILCMLLLVAFVGLPLFRGPDVAPTSGGRRVATLDGLRGLLALSVFLHHATVNYRFQQTGVWTVPPSPFYAMLGQGGVALFFMITGYLFWQKLLLENGRPRWTQLFIGRAFRIGPLYLLFVVLMLALILAKSHGRFEGTVFGFAKSLALWLPFGALGPGPDLNHLTNSSVSIGGATWSLQYEWGFYLSLVPLAFFARSRLVSVAACAVGGAVALALVALLVRPSLVAPPSVCVTTFLAGMTTAAVQNVAGPLVVPQRWASASVLVLTIAALCLFPSAHGAAPVVVLALIFALVASGCSVFGVLVGRNILRLGDMSYSLYLLHGVVLSAVFSIGGLRTFAFTSPERYWIVVALCGIILVTLSTLSLVAIERPGIALGRRIGRKIAAVRLRSAEPAAVIGPCERRGG